MKAIARAIIQEKEEKLKVKAYVQHNHNSQRMGTIQTSIIWWENK